MTHCKVSASSRVMRCIAVLMLVLFSAAQGVVLFDALQTLNFRNNGTTRAADTFAFEFVHPVGPGQVRVIVNTLGLSADAHGLHLFAFSFQVAIYLEVC